MVVPVRLVVRLLLLVCTAGLLVAAPSTAVPPAAGPAGVGGRASVAAECATLGRTVASVWSGQRSEAGPVCADLAQEGSVSLRFVQPVGEEVVPVRVLDAEGGTVCEVWAGLGPDPVCRLEGPPPYRAVVPAGSPQGFHLSVVELSAGRRGCPTLEVGSYGTRDGVDLAFAGDGAAFAACFSVPNEELQATFNTVAYERTSGSGEADLVVRPEFVSRQECTTTGQGGVGSVACRSGDRTGYLATVVLVSDGQPSGWRLVRRVPRADEAAGCQPVTSTDLGGPVTAGTTDSYVAMDCWQVPAEPTDEFAFDLIDQDASTTLWTFVDGSYACHPDDVLCLARGDRRYYLVPAPGGPVPPGGHDYELQPWLVGDARGWSPACERYGDYDEPFGPATGTLSSEASGRCVLLDSYVGAGYDLDLGSGSPQPTVRAAIFSGVGYHERCHPTSETTLRCNQLEDPLHTVPLLVSRPDGVATLDYSVSGECAPLATCDVMDPLRPVREPVVVGDHVVGEMLSVDTGEWEPEQPSRFSYEWLVDGTPVSVGDSLILTETMGGREVSVRVITDVARRESAVVVTAPQLVRGTPTEPLRPPTLSGETRVGRVLTVDPGRWRPAPDRHRFVWYAGDRRLAVDGRRLLLRGRHVGVRIVVRVVAVADGDRIGSATARSARVRGR